jgi:hypothetical protein
MALTTTGSWRVTGTLTKAIGALTGSIALDLSSTMALAAGTGLGAADKVYYARPTIAGSTTLSLDLQGGLLDVYGDAFTVARVKLNALTSDVIHCPIVIQLSRASAGIPLLGATGDFINIRPGGSLVWYAPDATAVVVTATTADLVDIINTAAGNVQPEVLIIGVSV